MNTTQSARLVLRTNSISSTPSYTTNSTLTRYTFSGIDLRTVLGDMYDKHDTFNLCLKSIASEASDASDLSGVALDDLAVIINIKGLPFINQTYSFSTENSINKNTDTASLTTVNFLKGDSLQLYFMNNQLTFSKQQQLCDLTFQYETVKLSGLPDAYGGTVIFPEMCYIFDIYGVGEAKDVNKIMAQRFLIG